MCSSATSTNQDLALLLCRIATPNTLSSIYRQPAAELARPARSRAPSLGTPAFIRVVGPFSLLHPPCRTPIWIRKALRSADGCISVQKETLLETTLPRCFLHLPTGSSTYSRAWHQGSPPDRVNRITRLQIEDSCNSHALSVHLVGAFLQVI